jgi:acylpyruvate hydrolase
MKIICIGRNYAEHAKELNNPIPTDPVVFMKPPTALLLDGRPFYYPEFTSDLHYELELVVKIGKNGRHIQLEHAESYIEEIGLGIDFTARDIQDRCKKNGHPWEIAKAFDHSAVLGSFVSSKELDLKSIQFELEKNNEIVQRGNSEDMIFTFSEIIVFVSKYFRIQMGDYIFTGTPAGVGSVKIGDCLEGYLYQKNERHKMLFCEIK